MENQKILTEPVETERLIIRRIVPGDWEDIHEILSRKEVAEFEPYEPFTPEQSKLETVNRAFRDDFIGVELKAEHKMIGNFYFHSGEFDTYEVGYVFNPDYWGNGYAAEGLKALIDYAFDVMKVRRLFAQCNPLNAHSWKLLERVGMRRESHILKNIYFKRDADGNPIWLDTYEYGLLREEVRGN